MAKEKDECCNTSRKWTCGACPGGNGGGAVYGLGLIGALFYYLGQGGSFGSIVMGILKSLVWPAIFVYHLFTYLKL